MMIGYFSTQQLCRRYDCSRRTIFRWMQRDHNPFPEPVRRRNGSMNLWLTTAVAAWEEREMTIPASQSQSVA